MPFDIETSHASTSGATLHLYVTKAKGSPRGVIQINHGLAERAARYARFAETMAAFTFTHMIIAAMARPSRLMRRPGSLAIPTERRK